mgnify:CR=1 FL=1
MHYSINQKSGPPLGTISLGQTVYTLEIVITISRFHQVWYQGGVKATVSGVVEDLKFKISEGSDQNW